MAEIDIEELRESMKDYCGTAAMSGFPAALIDLMEIESADPRELCEKAEELGIDLQAFVVNEE